MLIRILVDTPDHLSTQQKELIEKESEIRYQKFETLNDYNGFLYKDLNKYLNEQYLIDLGLLICLCPILSQRVRL